MEIAISDDVIKIIRRHIDKISVKLPLKSEEEVDELTEYFWEIECDLAHGLSLEMDVDRDLLEDAARVVTEFSIYNDEDYVDLEKLNKRLMEND